ncbi:unnamed protein product [Nesidiocoris tenuis]|uniref:Uncharacterized protein n=1 Tax=Nesidiocoris tenuis TaxID=355587 RepID=A0A6H5GJK0_9HEMI|nr:unnamed protein product [Nesidiocoris tenuis]
MEGTLAPLLPQVTPFSRPRTVISCTTDGKPPGKRLVSEGGKIIIRYIQGRKKKTLGPSAPCWLRIITRIRTIIRFGMRSEAQHQEQGQFEVESQFLGLDQSKDQGYSEDKGQDQEHHSHQH